MKGRPISKAVICICTVLLVACKSDTVKARSMLDQATELAQENKTDEARKILGEVISEYGDIQEGAEAKHLLDVLDARRNQTPDENSLRHELLVQVGRFALDCGRYPTLQEGLNALLVNPGLSGWKGPYLDKSWNEKIGNFDYRLPNDQPEIIAKPR